MSVANFPYRPVRYFTASGNAPVNLPGTVAANSAANAISPALITNAAPPGESSVTLSPGSYYCSADAFVTIDAAQTACQKMELCLHEVIAGVTQPAPAFRGPTYTAAAIVGAALTINNVQVHLEFRKLDFVMAATRSWAVRISYNGMPNAAVSTVNFSTLEFIKVSDDVVLSQLSFKT
jgi:hypothetical protein